MLQLPETPRRTKILGSLEEAYEQCRQITAHYAKTFYLGTLLMPEAKRRGIWAIYLWCRKTDELVDGPQAAQTTTQTLDDWEEHLESVFSGHPQETVDVALIDTIERYELDIQPFRDMIAGQRMDLYRSRYETFEELKLYCYRVAGTVGLMSAAVMGIETFSDRLRAPWVSPFADQDSPLDQAVALGIANQLTNILRDVGEDARRGRIYLPLEDLDLFSYTEQDLFKGVIDNRWCSLMKFQIARARKFFTQAEGGIRALEPDARWPVWSALILYRQILDVIERNHYNVFTQRAYVPSLQKMTSLPVAWILSR
ncbi:squalene/phytoene synthase family protein [Synechococcales cyanobacterium C]|uniref:15-cis-phytoene synthase n=1 Tax=Petrachloros mirabilis ULC683 TaxID=2781853 RepID=A0A8K2AGP8_9CYAN|nr:phytoene synthase [Petrachloros mirabilis]NCJ04984.1 squalene/phytoene synthase family protein [Petrachloros mirabilis ULC683]